MPSNDQPIKSENGRPSSTPPRRSVLNFAGVRTTRLGLTRKKLAETAWTLVWVAPLSILIWVYAEREQVLRPNSPNLIGVPIDVVSSDPDRLYVDYSDGVSGKFNLKVSGPQEAIDQVRTRLSGQAAGRLKIRLRPEAATLGIHQSLNVREKIVDDSLFRNAGVTVEEVQPPQAYIDVEQVTRKPVAVQLSPDVLAAYPSAQLNPVPTVQVSGPAQAMSTPVKVYANLAGLAELKQPGTHVLPSVALELAPGEEKLHLATDVLPVTLFVRDNDITMPISSIQVVVQAPPSLLRDYDVSFDASIPPIRMTGPPSVIEAIQKGTSHVLAIVEVQPEDEVNPAPKRRLKFEKPADVQVNEDDAKREYDFTVTARPHAPR